MAATAPPDVRASLGRFGALPAWLAGAVDPDLIGAVLARHEPGLAIRGVTAKRLRLKGDGSAWTGRYQVTAAGPDGAVREVALTGTLHPPAAAPAADDATAAPFGTAGWRRILPELGLELAPAPGDEVALPTLPALTDPERARALLEEQIRAAAPAYAGLRLAGCTPRVVRYKPGSRCTILYDLAYPPGAHGPQLVAAKTYGGEKGRNAWDGMRALWKSPLAAGDVVTIAEPLAYVPELRVLLQGPVPEQRTLKELIRSALDAGTPEALAELDAAMDRTAAGLAALHASGVEYGEPVTIDDELDEIRGVLRAMAVSVPELADAAGPLLTRVTELAARHPGDPAVPAHRSFRPAQVLLHDDRIGFIDFDGICQTEPAIDVALFVSSVKGLGLVDRNVDPAAYDQQLGQLERICGRFLERYRALAPISRERVALWETLDLLTDVMHAWTKVKPSKLPPAMLLLERHLEVSGLA